MSFRNTTAWILSLALLLGLQGSAASSDSPKSIELSALIESFLVDEGETATSFDWATEIAAGDAVHWRTKDVEEVRGVFQRWGEVVATVDRDEKAPKEIPDSWNLTLLGSKAGFDRVKLENMGDNYALAELTHYYVEALARKLSVEPYRCKNEPASFGTAIYSVEKQGKKTAWLVNEHSCGSAGCMLSLDLVFDRAGADEIQCVVDDMPPKADWKKWMKENP